MHAPPAASITPITYPARPINGGPLEVALPKSGNWDYEPKYNGWRAQVHTPTGAMFNRKGERLSIESEFKAALQQLFTWSVGKPQLEWLDCEALDRRHNLGRGSLIVLDAPSIADRTYAQRRAMLEQLFETAPLLFTTFPLLSIPPRVGTVAYADCQMLNRDVLQCEFYEGLVAKRADSKYPIQLRRPEKEFPFWVKHRWAW